MLAALLVTAYTKMNVILKHLSNCRSVQVRAPTFGMGPVGRLLLLSEVIGILRNADYYLKHGNADPNDLKNFPPNLKRLLFLQYNIVLLLLIAMFILFGAGCYLGWIE
ncbi:hypothetical protein [Halopseudomonas litoralis]|nr:hypothetical protein [Halopseudomonas litoralis]